MSVSFVQSKSAMSTSGASVAATFTSNIAAGDGLIAAVTWIDVNSNSSAYPTITVADSFGAWNEYAASPAPDGGDILTALFFIPYCKVGPNGAVTATASAPGLMFINIHEFAPDAGQIFAFDQFGVNSGIGWTSDFSFPFGTLIQVQPDSLQYTADDYFLLVFAARNGNVDPTVSGFTSREYQLNTSPLGTLGVLGSQATLDSVGSGVAGAPFGVNPAWALVSSIVNALLVVIASIPAVADAPTANVGSGEYTAPPTITLTQDQGLAIYYTTDGSTPTTSSSLYSSPITAVGPTFVLKCIGAQPASGWPSGFWASSAVQTFTYDIYTGVCLNPRNVIDGDDTTFATLTCNGGPGDVVAVKANMMNGTTGGPGNIVIDFEVTQNNLVAPSQTDPAWKVSAFIGGSETVLASAAPGAGVAARTTVMLAVSAGVSAPTLAAKVAAICQDPGSSGGVQLKVYAAYLLLSGSAPPAFGQSFGSDFAS